MSNSSVLSNLGYHSYLANVIHMGGDFCQYDCSDEQPSGQGTRNDYDFFARASLSISDICGKHRGQMEEAARRYWLENLTDLQDGPSRIPRTDLCAVVADVLRDGASCTDQAVADVLDRLPYLSGGERKRLLDEIQRKCSATHLYRPLCAVGFGHTDNLAIFTSDEFSHSGWALEDVELPVRQTCVAMCPDLREIKKSDGLVEPFCDVADLFDKVEDGEVPRMPFLESRPLVAVTYFRTLGLANLGSGLLFQEAMLRAMRQNIATTIRNGIQCDDRLATREDDIKRLRCAFMIPVGWSDVATVMVGTNYSVMFTLLDAMSRIRFNDLYEVMERAYPGRDILREVVREFDVHARLSAMASGANPGPTVEDPLLGHNHLFRSMVTTLAMDHHAFLGSDADAAYTGRVCADPHFSISPGHMRSVKQDQALWMIDGDAEMYEPRAPKDTLWITAGPYDSSDRALFLPELMPLMDLADLVKRVKVLRGQSPEPSDRRSSWDIRDLFSEITVPLLRVNGQEREPLKGDGADSPHSGISPLLARLRRDVFGKDEFGKDGLLSIDVLKSTLAELRLPSPLRGALVRSFTDFAKAMSDPLLFDNVLDIYDLFAAAHRVLTCEMDQKVLKAVEEAGPSGIARESARLSLLSEEGVGEIIALAELLEDALRRRTEVGFRQARRWQEAIDSRGGFSKLISAADVPIKCGLDVIRRLMRGQVPEVFEDDSRGEDYGFLHARVAGASKISYNTSAVTRRFDLGDDTTNFIADLSLSITHLTRPAFLLAHLHETGHLLSDLIQTRDWRCPLNPEANGCDSDKCFWAPTDAAPGDRRDLARLRCEEVFAEMLAFGLICGQNVSESAVAYLRQYMSIYFLDPLSMHPNPRMSLLRLVEVLAVGFMAVDPFIVSAANADMYEVPRKDGLDIESARDRFASLVEESGPLFFDHRRFWSSDSSRAYILEQFDRIYEDSFNTLRCIWWHARAVLDGVCGPVSEDGENGTSPPLLEQGPILESFRTGLVEARPVVRFIYNDESRGNANDDELRKHLDATFVMRHALGTYVLSQFSLVDVKKECCYLPGHIAPEGSNIMVLDRQANGLACMDFEQRGKFLGQRLSVLMTLWDLSTAIRARSLRHLLPGDAPEPG